MIPTLEVSSSHCRYYFNQYQYTWSKEFIINLDPHKATDSDNVPTCLLKQLRLQLTPVFTMIFQASLQQWHV